MRITQLFLIVMTPILLLPRAHANNESGTASLMDPVEAMELVMSEPLKYVGQFIPSSSDAGIPTCLFKNAKVTVVYTYCRKSEAPAYGLIVYSNTVERGHISFYAEGDGRPVSELDRSEYMMYMWRILSRVNAPGYRAGMTAKEYSNHHDIERTYYNSGCHVWQSYSKPVDASCLSEHQAQANSWINVSYSFWNNPSRSWYEVQTYLRSLIKSNSAIR